MEVADESFFFQVMRGGFLLRRKTLVNSLAPPASAGRSAQAGQTAACRNMAAERLDPGLAALPAGPSGGEDELHRLTTYAALFRSRRWHA